MNSYASGSGADRSTGSPASAQPGSSRCSVDPRSAKALAGMLGRRVHRRGQGRSMNSRPQLPPGRGAAGRRRLGPGDLGKATQGTCVVGSFCCAYPNPGPIVYQILLWPGDNPGMLQNLTDQQGPRVRTRAFIAAINLDGSVPIERRPINTEFTHITSNPHLSSRLYSYIGKQVTMSAPGRVRLLVNDPG